MEKESIKIQLATRFLTAVRTSDQVQVKKLLTEIVEHQEIDDIAKRSILTAREKGESALHIAILRGGKEGFEILKLLLPTEIKGVRIFSVDLENSQHYTPLQLSLLPEDMGGPANVNLHIINLLVEHGASTGLNGSGTSAKSLADKLLDVKEKTAIQKLFNKESVLPEVGNKQKGCILV